MDKVLTAKEVEECRDAFKELIDGMRPLMPHRSDEDWLEAERRLNLLCDMALKSSR